MIQAMLIVLAVSVCFLFPRLSEFQATPRSDFMTALGLKPLHVQDPDQILKKLEHKDESVRAEALAVANFESIAEEDRKKALGSAFLRAIRDKSDRVRLRLVNLLDKLLWEREERINMLGYLALKDKSESVREKSIGVLLKMANAGKPPSH